MENNSIDNQINNLMRERRQGFNDYTKRKLSGRNYLQGFDENYYLKNDTNSSNPNIYSVSGSMNDDLEKVFPNDLSGEQKKTLKEKAFRIRIINC